MEGGDDMYRNRSHISKTENTEEQSSETSESELQSLL